MFINKNSDHITSDSKNLNNSSKAIKSQLSDNSEIDFLM